MGDISVTKIPFVADNSVIVRRLGGIERDSLSDIGCSRREHEGRSRGVVQRCFPDCVNHHIMLGCEVDDEAPTAGTIGNERRRDGSVDANIVGGVRIVVLYGESNVPRC